MKRVKAGFTLVEILIVVIILGILASIVLPQFSNASQTTRQNTLLEVMRFMRTEIEVYKAQHNDISPGYPGGDPSAAPDGALFVNQLTQYTDAKGNCSATYSATYHFGPYIREMPVNPFSSLSTLRIDSGTGAITPDDSTGWIYQPGTVTFKPNLSGNDPSGVAFSTY